MKFGSSVETIGLSQAEMAELNHKLAIVNYIGSLAAGRAMVEQLGKKKRPSLGYPLDRRARQRGRFIRPSYSQSYRDKINDFDASIADQINGLGSDAFEPLDGYSLAISGDGIRLQNLASRPIRVDNVWWVYDMRNFTLRWDYPPESYLKQHGKLFALGETEPFKSSKLSLDKKGNIYATKLDSPKERLHLNPSSAVLRGVTIDFLPACETIQVQEAA